MSNTPCSTMRPLGMALLATGLIFLALALVGLPAGLIMMLSGASGVLLGFSTLAAPGPWVVLMAGGLAFFGLLLVLLGLVALCACCGSGSGSGTINPFTLLSMLSSIAQLMPLYQSLLNGLDLAATGLSTASAATGQVRVFADTVATNLESASTTIGGLTVPVPSLGIKSFQQVLTGNDNAPDGPPWVLTAGELGTTAIFGGVQTNLHDASTNLGKVVTHLETLSADLGTASTGLRNIVHALRTFTP